MAMILQSRLSKTAYPMADPTQWLYGDVKNLDPVFAGRLAAYAKWTGIKIRITDGFRSLSDQWEIYGQFKAGEIPSAAYPGTSWHGISLAVDTSTDPIRSASNKVLKAYGLCKPLSKEGWHIQPIETIDLGTKATKSWQPVDLTPLMKSKFALSDSTMEYIAAYPYAASFCEQLLAGDKKFEASTLRYFKDYKYWASLQAKTGIIAA
jgi:hypothetical protein